MDMLTFVGIFASGGWAWGAAPWAADYASAGITDICRGWNNSDEKNIFDFAQFGASIKYYGNKVAPEFGNAMKFQYDAIGLIIGAKGVFNIFRRGGKQIPLVTVFMNEKLETVSGIGDMWFSIDSIYYYWYDLVCPKCGK